MAAKKGNFVKIDRGILNWEWYQDINTKAVFLHCLLRANWEDNQWQGMTIKRGSFLTSLPTLAKELRMTISQIRTALKHLTLTGELTVCSTPKSSVITVNNYNRFNGIANKTADESQTESQTNRRQIATNKNNKEYKEVEVKESGSAANCPSGVNEEADDPLSRYYAEREGW